MWDAVQLESTAKAPPGLGRTDARGVFNTARSRVWTGRVLTNSAVVVASGILTPNVAAIWGAFEQWQSALCPL
jgi:hypothetical protein